MASKQPEKVDPMMGIRKFAGPTEFDWMALSRKDPHLVIRPSWLGKWSIPKPKYPPSLVTGKPPKRWPKDRMPELSYIYVNVVLFQGLEGVQILFVPLPLYEMF